MKKSVIRTITTVAITAIAIVIIAGCGDDTVSTERYAKADEFLGRFAEGGPSHPLVLREREAWTNEFYAFVFYEDRTCTYYERRGGVWVHIMRGEWDDDEVNLENNIRFTHSIDEYYLILVSLDERLDPEDRVITLTRTSGVNINP